MEASALLAVVDIESAGAPFEPADGVTPQFLFERHIFYAQLKARALGKLQTAVNQGLAHATWQPSTQYKDQNTSVHRLALLARAVAVDADCAYRSCSWGLGQTMGFQANHLGYDSAEHMVAAMRGNIPAQVEAMIGEIKYSKLETALANHAWATFARGYNGAGYRKNQYDTKLAQAYARWARPGEDDTPAPSEDVRWLQTALNSAGAHIASDGFDGPETEGAVKAFQAAHGLAADGIAGPITIAALKSAPATRPVSVPTQKPTTEASTMTTSTPATSPVSANPVVAAAVKAATAPIKSIWSSITGIIASIGGGAVATVLTTVAPNLTAEIAGSLGIAFAVVNGAAHIYTLITGQIANNNATIALAENLLNEIENLVGGKPFVFDNGSPATPAAS